MMKTRIALAALLLGGLALTACGRIPALDPAAPSGPGTDMPPPPSAAGALDPQAGGAASP